MVLSGDTLAMHDVICMPDIGTSGMGFFFLLVFVPVLINIMGGVCIRIYYEIIQEILSYRQFQFAIWYQEGLQGLSVFKNTKEAKVM